MIFRTEINGTPVEIDVLDCVNLRGWAVSSVAVGELIQYNENSVAMTSVMGHLFHKEISAQWEAEKMTPEQRMRDRVLSLLFEAPSGLSATGVNKLFATIRAAVELEE